MQNHPGVFLAIEGSDGSGKSTQFRLTVERLKAAGHEVEVFKFPQHGEASSYFVNSYLGGDYGPATEVSPYTASLFYALDRYHASPKIRSALSSGKIVIADRYVGSNMAHQGAKFTSPHEQRGFFMWAENLEYQLLGIPRPDLNLLLKVPASISQRLIAKRAAAGAKLDEHEKDQGHLAKAIDAYDQLWKLFPKDFKQIESVRDNQLLSIVEVNDLIWQTIKPLLPPPKRKGKGVVLRLDQPPYSSSSKRAAKLSEPRLKQVKETKEPKKETGINLEAILSLQKQMISRSGSLRSLNQRRLKAAINLLTPLHYRKVELEELLGEKKSQKTSPNDEPVALNDIIRQLAAAFPTPESDEQIKLLTATPRNEFDLQGDAKNVSLNYQQKEQALVSELKRVAANANYHFETTSDWATLLAFNGQFMTDAPKILGLDPGLSYRVPEIIETAGLEEPYKKAFEFSARQYSQIIAHGGKDAISTLLLGHNVRWKFKVDAAALSRASKASENQEALRFLYLLQDKITENHPHVAKFLASKEPVRTPRAHKKHR